MPNEIIGKHNAGFDIIEAAYTYPNRGYCLGKSETQFVTWAFWVDERNEVSFHFGNYFPGTDDYTRACAYEDFYDRMRDFFHGQAVYLRG